MKLATLKDGRDGRLVVVSGDLARCASAANVAPTLQAALDSWATARPALESIAAELESGGGDGFDETTCASPLPRAYQWADGSAYVNHVELVRKARGAEMPDSFWTEPLMYQGGSDSFLWLNWPGASILRQRSRSSPTMYRWASLLLTRSRTFNSLCSLTTCLCAGSFLANSRKASASSSRNLPVRFHPSPSRPMSSATAGRMPRFTCHCCRS